MAARKTETVGDRPTGGRGAAGDGARPRRLDSAVAEARRVLRAQGVAEEATDAAVLVAHVVGADRSALHAHGERLLTAAQHGQLTALVSRRAAGEPVAYLTGVREFWSLPFRVDPRVLVPRPESEHLVETVLAECVLPDPVVIDVGTGSGCIGLAIAHDRPRARVLGLDVSAGALTVARRNARALGLRERFAVACVESLDAVGKAVADVVVSNPPYIDPAEVPGLAREVREHEPLEALTCGELGMAVTRRIISAARRVLVPGGMLVLEIEPARRADVEALLADDHWDNTHVRRDLAGRDRVVWSRLRKAAW